MPMHLPVALCMPQELSLVVEGHCLPQLLGHRAQCVNALAPRTGAPTDPMQHLVHGQADANLLRRHYSLEIRCDPWFIVRLRE